MESSASSGQPLLKGRYLIEKELGRGGIGVVYLARDQQLHNKPVVIKVLLQSAEESGNSQWFRKKFNQEIEALSRIEHPGVVGVLDAGATDDGKSFLVMQFIEGKNLRSIIQPQGVELERVADIIKQMGLALTAAHDKGILHCDLKPENIMLQVASDEDDHVKLIDFGVAKLKDSQFGKSGEATKVAGTVWYMAPEQLQGQPTHASDIYAMGAIAYELVTGRPPFTPDTPYQLLEMQRAGVAVKPSALRPSLPAAAEQSILKALSPEPQQRHARAKEFGDELSKAITGRSTLPLTPSQSGQAATNPQNVQATNPEQAIASLNRTVAGQGAQTIDVTPKKNPLVPIIAIAGVLALAIAGWWIFGRSSTPTTPSNPPVTKTTAPERSLNYSILVQKTRDGKPFQEPFKLASEINFEPGYQVRLLLNSPQSGHLYLVNEGPESANGQPQYLMMFPSELMNQGSATINANQAIQFPDKSWFIFDQEQGTEKIWLVWSAKSVAALDAIGPATQQNKGVVSKSEQIEALKKLFASAEKTETNKDDANKQTVIKGQGETIIHLLKLEHH